MNYKIGDKEFVGTYPEVVYKVGIWYHEGYLQFNNNGTFTLRDITHRPQPNENGFVPVFDIKQKIIDIGIKKIPRERTITIEGNFSILIDGQHSIRCCCTTLDDLIKIKNKGHL